MAALTTGIIDEPTEPETPSFTYEDVKRLVADRDIRTIEGLLEALPEGMRGRIMLAHESESVQPATPNCPRIILFEDDASLAMGISGHTKDVLCDPALNTPLPMGETDFEVEIIQWRPALKKFEFNRLTLSGEGPAKFDDNTTACTGCHRPKPRPLWEGFPVWPKFYGIVNDQIKDGTVEKKEFDRFCERNASKGRYRYLVTPCKQEPRYSKLRKHHAYDVAVQPDRPRPNWKYSFEAAKLNHQRIAKLIADTNPDAPTKIALVAATLDCPDFRRFVPAARLADYTAKIAGYTEKAKDSAKKNLTTRQKRALELVDADIEALESPDTVDAPIMANLQWLLEGKLSTDLFSLAAGAKQVVFFNGRTGLKELAAPLAAELFPGMSGLVGQLANEGFRLADTACDALAAGAH